MVNMAPKARNVDWLNIARGACKHCDCPGFMAPQRQPKNLNDVAIFDCVLCGCQSHLHNTVPRTAPRESAAAQTADSVFVLDTRTNAWHWRIMPLRSLREAVAEWRPLRHFAERHDLSGRQSACPVFCIGLEHAYLIRVQRRLQQDDILPPVASAGGHKAGATPSASVFRPPLLPVPCSLRPSYPTSVPLSLCPLLPRSLTPFLRPSLQPTLPPLFVLMPKSPGSV